MDSEVQVTVFLGYPLTMTQKAAARRQILSFNSVINILLSTWLQYYQLDGYLKSCFIGVLAQVKFIRRTLGGIRYQVNIL